MGRTGDRTIAVVGAGPAGLMAAEAASEAGARVAVFDRMPSPARKFLMAGKSGLNLTRREPSDAFRSAYGDAAPRLSPMLDAFGPDDAVTWMEGLGQDAHVGSTGLVFPSAWKASPLLRTWLARLDRRGVTLHRRHRWTGWAADGPRFETADGPVVVDASATVLAAGGASWRRLGSDGAWAREPSLAPHAAPFRPANDGVRVRWSAVMLARAVGRPVKGVRFMAGDLASRGEAVVTARGLEGGGLYPLTPALRDGAALVVDLKPDLDRGEVARRLARPHGKATWTNHLRRALKLDPGALALYQEVRSGLADRLAPDTIKRLVIPHDGPAPLDEAISTAGGLRLDALDGGLMLRDRPGAFACGEMLDWEAPTGGYLLTACLATGRWAGRAAAAWAHASAG